MWCLVIMSKKKISPTPEGQGALVHFLASKPPSASPTDSTYVQAQASMDPVTPVSPNTPAQNAKMAELQDNERRSKAREDYDDASEFQRQRKALLDELEPQQKAFDMVRRARDAATLWQARCADAGQYAEAEEWKQVKDATAARLLPYEMQVAAAAAGKREKRTLEQSTNESDCPQGNFEEVLTGSQ